MVLLLQLRNRASAQFPVKVEGACLRKSISCHTIELPRGFDVGEVLAMQIQPDTVRQMIELARDWDEQYQRARVKTDGVISLSDIASEASRYDPARLKLLEAIHRLPLEQKAEVQALYWLGREREESIEKDSESDLDAEDLTAYWENLLDLSIEDCESASDYLLAKKASLLVSYLSEGLNTIVRLRSTEAP